MEFCPVCNNNAKVTDKDYHDKQFVDCPRCGEFKISNYVVDQIGTQEGEENSERYILSYWIKQHQNDDIIEIDRKLYYNIIEQATLPEPKEISDNLIKLIGKKQKNRHAEPIELDIEYISSDIGAVGKEEVHWIACYLQENQFIYYSNSSNRKYRFRLELEGWDRYEEISKRGVKTTSAFLAMPYGNEELDKIYNEHFKFAVSQTAFQLKRLDETPSHGLIDERIRFQIQEYRFLVAELTYNNHNVIWEAGYAEGLRKPVMYLCQQGEWFDKAKEIFDINHQTIIPYNPNDEVDLKRAKEKLKAMIRNAIPEAKRTDDKLKSVNPK